MKDQIVLKEQLFRKCTELVQNRIDSLESALESLFQSKLMETKSSARDKFETGRAMMQMEEEKLKTQLHRAREDMEILLTVAQRNAADQVGPGNLVSTTQGQYLIAIGVGKVMVGGERYYCVSAQSPIGEKLCGSGVGDIVDFNGREFGVEGIC